MLFSAWWATTGGSSKGLHASHSPLASILLGKGPAGSWSGCHLQEEALKAFEVLKQACMTASILVFTDYTKPFLLETDAY